MPCGSYVVQVGAFRDRVEAQAVAAMAQAVFAPPVRSRQIREHELTRVRVGPFADLDAAHRALARVARDGHGEALILELDAAGAQCEGRRA